MNKCEFPKGFLWGSATSAYQIEGGNHNDWSMWEKSPERTAQLKKEGMNPSDFVSGMACDSYHRFEEDFDIAKSLNHNVHRISLEWSRIEPEEGKFNHEAIQHYKRVVKAIRDRGMEPMITLWHFTNPIWFTEDGGFTNKENISRFIRFVRFSVENLKTDVSLWITFNEATTVYSSMSFLLGAWPPQQKSLYTYLKTLNNFANAHKLAYKEIKSIYSQSPLQKVSKNVSPNENSSTDMSHNIGDVKVGVVENNSQIICPWYLDMLGIGKLVAYFRNYYLFSSCRGYYDFIGLNYYNILRLPGSLAVLPRRDIVKEMNWEIYPAGISYVLRKLRKYDKPIYITENGIADEGDSRRAKFIKNHLYQVWLAIRDGCDVRGYLYWSLLDNFEWHRGYNPRFGLMAVDYEHNRTRTIRASAYEYAKIISDNGFEL